MRLLGQRSVPDSYIFQNLVSPNTGGFKGDKEAFTLFGSIRAFPRELDLMAVLGSSRASEILEVLNDSSYENYDSQLSLMRGHFNSTEGGQGTLYGLWLRSLQPLLIDFGPGYPAFMQSPPWREKELVSALASWSELRHDTILYARQGYTEAGSAAGFRDEREHTRGYVEPVPQFYSSLLDLTSRTREGLKAEGALDQYSDYRLGSMEDLLSELLNISEKELQGRDLSQDEYEFIRDFGHQISFATGFMDEEALRSTAVADVHTDTNSLQVLEEGVGDLKLLVVAYKLPEGSILLRAGPALSYYEFKQPINERLDDPSWRKMLHTSPPPEPQWFRARSQDYPALGQDHKSGSGSATPSAPGFEISLPAAACAWFLASRRLNK